MNKFINKLNKFYKPIEVLLVISVLFYLTISGITYFNNKKIEGTIKTGQIWVFNDDVNDPFNIENPRFRKVIDMKGDYVKYVTIYHDTLSAVKSKFIENSKPDNYYRGYYKIDLNK